jgi:hypothetical protein
VSLYGWQPLAGLLRVVLPTRAIWALFAKNEVSEFTPFDWYGSEVVEVKALKLPGDLLLDVNVGVHPLR